MDLQREMSSKVLQSLRRKTTREDENRRCTVFDLAVNSVKSGSGYLGSKKLNSLIETMAQKAGLGPNFKNHNRRKTMIQTLVNNDVPPTDIMQLSGQKRSKYHQLLYRLKETTVEHVSHSHWT